MDLKLFALFYRFSHESTETAPPDQETLGLRFMQRAYALGREAGRAEAGRDGTDTNYQWHSPDTD